MTSLLLIALSVLAIYAAVYLISFALGIGVGVFT